MTRGSGIPGFERIPYFPEQAHHVLADVERLVLVEAKPPVSFFGYPGIRSLLAPPTCAFDVVAEEHEDGASALEWLAEEIDAPAKGAAPGLPRSTLPSGEPLTPAAIARAVAVLAPEGSIFSDESVSASGEMWPHLACAERHDHLPVTGGSIGQGLPVAVGAALACPDRKVVALEADGSAMYTLQSLWTMARERLDVTIVILANRRYRILDIEMKRTGAGAVGARAGEMIDLNNPAPEWIHVAKGFGIEATKAETADDFIREFAAAMRERGPRLIEAALIS